MLKRRFIAWLKKRLFPARTYIEIGADDKERYFAIGMLPVFEAIVDIYREMASSEKDAGFVLEKFDWLINYIEDDGKPVEGEIAFNDGHTRIVIFLRMKTEDVQE